MNALSPQRKPSAPIGAHYIVAESHPELINQLVLGDEVIMVGGGSPPAAGIKGRLYYRDDTFELMRDTGVVWQTIMFNPTLSYLINKSGLSVNAGDVVVIDPDNSTAFKLSTTPNDEDVIGVVVDTGPILNNFACQIMTVGSYEVVGVRVTGNVQKGEYIAHSSTQKMGISVGTVPGPGVFARALITGTDTVIGCLVFPVMKSHASSHSEGGSDELDNVPTVAKRLTNKSGGAVVAGDVVVVSNTTAAAFTTTNVDAYKDGPIFVALENIANDADGVVAQAGYVAALLVAGSVNIGSLLVTSTTPKRARAETLKSPGIFAIALGAGTNITVPVFIISPFLGVRHSGLEFITANDHHDEVHGNEDHTAAPTPSTIDIGDTADTGTDAGPARGDHEHAFPAPPVLHQKSTSSLTLTTTYQDLPGCSVTLNKSGTWVIRAIFAIEVRVNDTGQFLRGGLVVNGVQQPAGSVREAFANAPTAVQTATVAQEWVVTGVTAGHVAKLQGKKDGGTGTSLMYTNHCMITAEWKGP